MKSTPFSSSTSSPSSSSSPNCVRSLEAQLEKASLMSSPESKASAKNTSDGCSNDNDDNNTRAEPIPWSVVRDQILQLTVVTGNLSSLFLIHPRTPPPTHPDDLLPRSIVTVLQVLWDISQSLHIPLAMACQNKINLNNRKYPIDLCKVRTSKQNE
jgi:hypothetical protein